MSSSNYKIYPSNNKIAFCSTYTLSSAEFHKINGLSRNSCTSVTPPLHNGPC